MPDFPFVVRMHNPHLQSTGSNGGGEMPPCDCNVVFRNGRMAALLGEVVEEEGYCVLSGLWDVWTMVVGLWVLSIKC